MQKVQNKSFVKPNSHDFGVTDKSHKQLHPYLKWLISTFSL
jgi:hypothetical protein